MIDSITIFTKTGVILYHNNCQFRNNSSSSSLTSLTKDENVPSTKSLNDINSFLSDYILNHQSLSSQTTRKNKSKRLFLSSSSDGSNGSGNGSGNTDKNVTVAEWEEYTHIHNEEEEEEEEEWMVVALYPKVLLDRDISSSLSWIRKLLSALTKEYGLFYNSRTDGEDVPDEGAFEKTFRVLYHRYESLGRERKLPNDDDEDESEDRPLQNDAPTTTTKKTNVKKGKEARVWHDGRERKVTSESMAALDFSKTTTTKGEEEDSNALREARAAYLPKEDERNLWEVEESRYLDDDADGDDGDDDGDGGGGGSSGKSWGVSIKGMLSQMSGNKILEAGDLEAPISEMHEMLAAKNVASDIATEICDNVRDRLVGRRLASLTRVKTAVRQALEVTIEKILRPGRDREVDLLRAVVTKREMGSSSFFNRGGGEGANKKPYVIVMVGINGVGKSTSLSKIAYYLKSNKCNPLIAACDTFRSGAVEQLNVHAKCLDVPLYQKGYAKDPAAVAKAAIDHAKDEGNDVVLVDTAGRMQNNVPLMKALSSLVVQNEPDLVLFVCEALVGNDGIDQLEMFNRALRSGGHTRQIDGIILTKYDTVSDKVGAALTLTHLTGAPVVFVGTGQKYNHLMKLSTQSVIKSLFE